MRAIPSVLALLLLCGCDRTPPERPPVNQGKIDMFKISDLVFGRYTKLGFEKLSPSEKVFQCVWGSKPR